MADSPATKREVYKNARWALFEAEKDGSKQLLVIFSDNEVRRVGIQNLRRKFDLFQKLHLALGSRVLFATHILPVADKVVLTFSLKSKKKLALLSPHAKIPSPVFPVESTSPPNVSRDLPSTFHTLRTCSPIHQLKDFLATASYILRLFWEIHKQGMVHNGICMEGLIVRPVGLPKVYLVDIGDLRERPSSQAIFGSGTSGIEQQTVDIDIYKYSSPESTGRTDNMIDQRSDIYSLGALLYELATGVPPFISVTSDPLDLIHLHMTQPPPILPTHLWSTEHRTYAEHLTSVIHKMMKKAPAERYQSLYGTIRDLEYISRAVQRVAPMSTFTVALHDLRDQFHTPDLKLYGRERELSRVVQFIHQFRETRDTCIVLIGGASGVGKSTMVRKMLEAINTRFQQSLGVDKAHIMLTGKHDRIKHTPYSAVLEALGGIVRRVLMMQGQDLEIWRQQLESALSPNGQVLVDLMPEIATVLGPQLPVPILPPAENKSRFQRVLLSFMQVFLAQYPTILFLDDMQWADQSTVSLLEALALDSTVNNLTVVCAYRNNEVNDSHMFKLFMDHIHRKNPTIVLSLTLAPLSLECTTQLIMDSFHCESKDAALSLAQLAQTKTGGNPFFLGQFLRAMTNDKLIHFNYSTNEWEWSIAQLQAAEYTENVVEFVLLKIRKLSSNAREAAQIASCLGNRFDLETLAATAQTTTEEVVSRLVECIDAGFITEVLRSPDLNVSQPHKISEIQSSELLTNKQYKFAHDRVQEAFYTTVTADKRMETHLSIARILSKKALSEKEKIDLDPDELFTIAHHLNLSSDLVAKLQEDHPERFTFIDIAFQAAKKAKQTSAIQSAATVLHTASKLLPPDSITSHYSRTFQIYLLLAECEYSCGRHAEAETLFAFLTQHAATSTDKVRALLIAAVAFESGGNAAKSLDACLQALAVCNVHISTDVTKDDVRKMSQEVMALQKGLTGPSRRISDLATDLPTMDAQHNTIMEILHTMVGCSYVNGVFELFYYGVAYGCKVTLQFGVSPWSANSCVCFTGILAKEGQWEESYQFTKLALALTEVAPHPLTLQQVELNSHAFGVWQQETLHECKDTLTRSFRHSLETGSCTNALYCALNVTPVLLGCGEHLDDCESTITTWISELRNMTLTQKMVDTISCFTRILKVLKGTSKAMGKFDDDMSFLDHKKAMEDTHGWVFYVHLFGNVMQAATILEDYDLALSIEKETDVKYMDGIYGWYDFMTWKSILFMVSIPAAINQGVPPTPTVEQASRIAEVREIMKKLKPLRSSPSLGCRLTLVRAELARIKGNYTKAQELYGVALENARARAYTNILGFIHEQALKYYLAKGLERIAAGHFKDARAAYFSWGAYAKCKQLETKYSFLMHSLKALPSEVSSSASTNKGLDFSSVLRAYQVISSEMDLSKLITSMMQIVIQNTGAQNGIFLVPDTSGKLFIEAYGEGSSQEVHRVHFDMSTTQQSTGNSMFPQPPSSSDSTTQFKNSPKQQSLSLKSKPSAAEQTIPLSPLTSSGGHVPLVPPVGIVQYVYRTKAPVLLSDACHEGMFTFEPHIQNNSTKSVLCVPVLNLSRVVAVLYLENNFMTGAFTAERLEVVQLLSSQIGISFENASLYKNLQSANALLETKNKELMAMDHMKDQFLANTSHELRTPLNGIIGLAESLMDGATGTLSQATCNNLAMIVNSGRRLANLVNDILDMSALKAGGLIIRPHQTDLKRTLDDVIFLSSHLIGLKDLQLLDETGDLPHMMLDESRIQQVLQNIVGNAVKFTHKGKVVVTSRVTDDWVELIFSDTGCGIPADEFESIFEDFKQVDGTSTREVGGTGLGLSIAKRLIELHGGTIEVSSVLDKGSVFTIKLPTKLVIDENSSQKSIMASDGQWRTHTHKKYKEGVKTTTVLSVDDDPTNQMVVQKLLDAHFNVVQAMSGEEALDIISNSAKPPDFVLLDVMMPKMSGLEVCEKVREKFPMCDLPIIMVSAKSQPQHVVEGLRKGANDYMAKPINREELLARIRAQLMICHTCRMVCKNSSSEDSFLVCESCRRTKPRAPTRRPSLDFARDLVSELPNTIEILTHVPFGITLYSTEGRALMRNAEARRQFEGLPEITTNLSTAFLPHILDRATADLILSDAKQGGKFEKNVEVYSANHTLMYHRIFAKSIAMSIPEKHIEGSYILVVEWDVTEWWRKREEAARLRASDRQKTELIFDLAHNLKGPLSGLAALADDGSTSPQNGISLSTVALRMARLVDEIADYAEATNSLDDTNRPKNTATQINDVLDTVDILFMPTYRTKGVTVLRDPSPVPIVLAQRHKLTLLISYLLDISIQYSRSRMITIRAYAGSDSTVVVSFTDNARTCSTEELEELFAKSPVQGYLAPVIVRKVTEAIGATITFTPLSKGGSSINVSIPEVCLTTTSKERRVTRKLSTASLPPRRLQHSMSSPNIFRKKERMEPILEVESPPTRAPRRISSTPAFTPTPSAPSTSAPLPPPPTITTTSVPSQLPHTPQPTNPTASQLLTSHSSTVPEPYPLIPNPSEPIPFQTSVIAPITHPVIPNSISLPSPSLSSPSTLPYTPQLSPATPQIPPFNLQTAHTPSPHYQSGHAFLFGTPAPRPNPEQAQSDGANFLFGAPAPKPNTEQSDGSNFLFGTSAPKPNPDRAQRDGANFLFGKHDDKQSLEKEIKELEARLAMAKSLYKIKKLSVKFKRADQPFFHQVNMEESSVEQLRDMITKRLKLNPGQYMMMVKDGDTLVEMDEDVEDGMHLDVHIT